MASFHARSRRPSPWPPPGTSTWPLTTASTPTPQAEQSRTARNQLEHPRRSAPNRFPTRPLIRLWGRCDPTHAYTKDEATRTARNRPPPPPPPPPTHTSARRRGSGKCPSLDRTGGAPRSSRRRAALKGRRTATSPQATAEPTRATSHNCPPATPTLEPANKSQINHHIPPTYTAEEVEPHMRAQCLDQPTPPTQPFTIAMTTQ